MQTGIPVGRTNFSTTGNIQVIQLKDVNADGRLLSPLENVQFERPLNKDKLIKTNDVLLKGRGVNMTATLIKGIPATSTIASSAYFILRAKSCVLPAFLAWYLNNTRLPITRSSISLLQLRDLRQMHIHLPEDEIQQQVIDTYELIEEARMLSDQYHKKISQLLRGLALHATHRS